MQLNGYIFKVSRNEVNDERKRTWPSHTSGLVPIFPSEYLKVLCMSKP